ncbi:hypothetical protein RD110_21550 [Rhodoferax koreense]|uniref:Uncharacterized protein n=1 Tax=Rhodoferax koreensis TaxID=1842727 RepID=A0A1P8K4B4_9BURK|nr:hypothetical protein RD110_21550 [Rhodoferax koreense]
MSPQLAFAQDSACGPLANAYGPFDYRTEKGNSLHLVESAHFTPVVEALIKGNAGYLGGDLDYTLRAFPNHHRALLAVMRYGEKTKSPKPNDLRYSVECYFTRALQFRPDDTTARLLYASYLGKNSREAEALQQLERTNALAKDNPFTHYNIGLVYFDLKQYDKALAQAHIADDLGFTQTGLRDQLKAAGKWKDAPPRSAARAEAPASAAAPAASAPLPQ